MSPSFPEPVLRLPHSVSLAGAVAGASGLPATVWARPLAFTRGWGPGLLSSNGHRSARDGSFLLTGLRPEEHAVFAAAGSHFAWLPRVTPGGDPVRLDLRPGGEIEIDVRDPAGRPEAVNAQILRIDGESLEGALDPLPRRSGDRRQVFRFQAPAGRLGLVLLSAASQGEIELQVESGRTAVGKVVLDRPRSIPD